MPLPFAPDAGVVDVGRLVEHLAHRVVAPERDDPPAEQPRALAAVLARGCPASTSTARRSVSSFVSSFIARRRGENSPRARLGSEPGDDEADALAERRLGQSVAVLLSHG